MPPTISKMHYVCFWGNNTLLFRRTSVWMIFSVRVACLAGEDICRNDFFSFLLTALQRQIQHSWNRGHFLACLVARASKIVRWEKKFLGCFNFLLDSDISKNDYTRTQLHTLIKPKLVSSSIVNEGTANHETLKPSKARRMLSQSMLNWPWPCKIMFSLRMGFQISCA